MTIGFFVLVPIPFKIGKLFDVLVYFGLYIYNSRNVNYLDVGKLVIRMVWDHETASSNLAI